MLPFVGRLSCNIGGDNSTLVKEGGICILRNWNLDFRSYLLALKERLTKIPHNSNSLEHHIKHGDSRTFDFPKNMFDGLFTSPPYPNHRDFVSMFKPEQELLSILGYYNNSAKRKEVEDIIGSNFVSGNILSIAKIILFKFYSSIDEINRNANAIVDDDNYYIPFLKAYFFDLELAYNNISKSMKENIKGSIIEVNKAQRDSLFQLQNSF